MIGSVSAARVHAWVYQESNCVLGFYEQEGIETMRKLISSGLIGVATILGASSALAVEPSPTAGRGSVGALFGYGFKDGINLGFGVRGGYTLPANVYLGGTFLYHLGKSESTPFGDVSVKLYYFGAEGGYDFSAGPVVIRPYLGLGMATVRGEVPKVEVAGVTIDGSTSESRFAAWPGATLLYPIDSFFVGADARFLFISEMNAFSLYATGGVQF